MAPLGTGERFDRGPGKDVLVGGAGSDWFNARDKTVDRIDGGPGTDRATVDPRVDRLTSVEKFNKK